MRWLVKSRNRVVKSGDLDLHSTARLRLVESYYHMADAFDESMLSRDTEAETVKIVPPRTMPSEYATYLSGLPERALASKLILAERRWVDKALSNYELLDALAHCYGVLANLLADAHQRKGGASAGTARLLHEGRLPCMVTTLDVRTAHYRVTDGSLVTVMGRGIAEIGNFRSTAVRRYKTQLPELIDAAQPQSVIDLVDPIFTQAKNVLSKDKTHSHITMLYRGTELIDVRQTLFSDRADKYVYARDLAKAVLMTGADGVITIGEIWQSKVTLDDQGVVLPPAEVPDRLEALEVYAETSDGSIRAKYAYFRKRFGRISYYGEQEITESLENNMYAPTRAVWGSRSKEREQDAAEKFVENVREAADSDNLTDPTN
ncbi:hypothetical protein [Pseudonocardia cypriaca]|nr:hypothetical protein [Pseudonocardia cypriaca]